MECAPKQRRRGRGCNFGLLENPGSSLTENIASLDSGSITYTCPRGLARELAPSTATAHPCEDNMGVKTSAIGNNGAFDTIQVTYEGFIDNSEGAWAGLSKQPSGGSGIGTGENPIALHPNYTEKPGSWGEIFGDGPSPNAYGRVLEEGAFKCFGPQPDGRDGREDPINPNCEGNPDDTCRLIGVESFLDASAASYKYSRVTRGTWAPFDRLGYRCFPISALIPAPTLPADRDWLLTNCTEDIQVLVNSDPIVHAYTTTVEFVGSGEGGWNRLIYRPEQRADGEDIDLDEISTGV